MYLHVDVWEIILIVTSQLIGTMEKEKRFISLLRKMIKTLIVKGINKYWMLTPMSCNSDRQLLDMMLSGVLAVICYLGSDIWLELFRACKTKLATDCEYLFIEIMRYYLLFQVCTKVLFLQSFPKFVLTHKSMIRK